MLREAAGNIVADLELVSTKHDKCGFAQLTQVIIDGRIAGIQSESLTLSLNDPTSFEEKRRSFPEGATGWLLQYLELRRWFRFPDCRWQSILGLQRKKLSAFTEPSLVLLMKDDSILSRLVSPTRRRFVRVA